MQKTYAAVLHNGQIEWRGEAPPEADGPLDIEVTVRTPSTAAALPPEERRRRAAEALERLAEMNPFADIVDPVAWQREIRKDRPLPGRE